MEKRTEVKDGLILVAITLVATLLLSFVYEITKDPIAAQEAKKKVAAYSAVCEDLDSYDNNAEISTYAAAFTEYDKITVDEALVAKDADGSVIGLLMTITTMNGYGGQITFTMGYSTEGAVTGIAFLTLNETAGLGMHADDESFKTQFKAIADSFGLYKGNTVVIEGDVRVDAISSATVTSKAVTNAVNAGIKFANDMINKGLGGLK